MPAEGSVTAGDIARLAGVGRAAVSNWRRRFPDFPAPIGGTSTSPRYALPQVEDWLSRHGRTVRIGAADRLWQRLRASADDPQLLDHLAAAATCLLSSAHAPAGVPARDDDSAAADTGATGHAPGTVQAELTVDELLDAESRRLLDDAVCEQDADEVLETLHDRYLDAERGGPDVAALGETMCRLVDVSGHVVADPACGTGGLLRAAHRHGARRLLGAEAGGGAPVARARLLLTGADASIHIGHGLRDGVTAAADVALCVPPDDHGWCYDDLADDPRWAYGTPPRGEAELAWLTHTLAYLHDGGTAVLGMPGVVAGRRAGRRIRANLLRAGVLRAVLAPEDSSTHLWVLRRDGRDTDRILLRSGDSDDLVAAWQAFDADGTADGAVPVLDLLDEQADLDPARRRPDAPDPRSVTSFPAARAELADIAGGLADTLPELTPCPPSRPAATTTVDDLARTGTLTVCHPPVQLALGDGPRPVLTRSDLRHGRTATGRTGEAPDVVEIRAGDVVVGTDGPRRLVRVATESGAVLGPRLTLLRAEADRIDPYFLAGVLRADAQAENRPRPQAASRLGLRRVRLARLPIDEQRRYGRAYRRLLDAERRLRATTELTQRLLEDGYRGLAHGGLRPVGADRAGDHGPDTPRTADRSGAPSTRPTP